MPIVRVEPLGADIELLVGEALIDAAWRLGYEWPTTCWGQAECMMCRVRVIDGEDVIVPATADELDAMRVRLAPAARGPDVRLACRLKVTAAGATVEKVGVSKGD